jgi:CRP-like cAMP-binding protein
MATPLLSVFEGISKAELSVAMQRFRPARVEIGDVLMERGEQDPSLIVVLEGRVEMSVGAVDVGSAESGEVAGEMALFGSGRRVATVTAVEPTKLLILSREAYQDLQRAGNGVAWVIERLAVKQMVARLRRVMAAIARIADGVPPRPVEASRPPDNWLQRVRTHVLGQGDPGLFARMDIDVRGVLGEMSSFRRLPPEVLDALAPHLHGFRVANGFALARAGAPAEFAWIVARGFVEGRVEVGSEDSVHTVLGLGPGHIAGCSALVPECPYGATFVGAQDAVVFGASAAEFRKLLDGSTSGASLLRGAVIRSLAKQLAVANEMVADLEVARRDRVHDAVRADGLHTGDPGTRGGSSGVGGQGG